MPSMLQDLSPRLANRGLMSRIFLVFLLSAFVLAPRVPLAQQQPLHLNPVVAKLAEGKTVYGIQTNDWSLAPAKPRARLSISCTRIWSTIRSTSRRFTRTSWE
jgi:hypothetical protein